MCIQTITEELAHIEGLTKHATLDYASHDHISNNKSNKVSGRGPCFDEKSKNGGKISKP